MTKQQIIRKIEQRAMAQEKAKTLQKEIDSFFKSHGLSDEYVLSDSVALFDDPYGTMLEQKELLNKI